MISITTRVSFSIFFSVTFLCLEREEKLCFFSFIFDSFANVQPANLSFISRWNGRLLGLGVLWRSELQGSLDVHDGKRSGWGTAPETTAFRDILVFPAGQVPHRGEQCAELCAERWVLRKVMTNCPQIMSFELISFSLSLPPSFSLMNLSEQFFLKYLHLQINCVLRS